VRPSDLFAIALAALRGVGDPTLGEWREVGTRACHVRRRLSGVEAARVGPVRDLRGDRESLTRLWRALQWLPAPFWPMAESEIRVPAQ
jgi:hypothetical protein